MNTENKSKEKSIQIIANNYNRILSFAHILDGSNSGTQYTCSYSSLPKPGFEHISFFALFDGHTSSTISEHLSKELLNSILNADPVLFDSIAKNSITNLTGQELTKIKDVIIKGFLSIDKKMRDLPEIVKRKKPLPGTFELDHGSAAIACLITPTHILVANCGDSRAIIVSKSNDRKITKNALDIVLSTRSHKPDNLEEQKRIRSENGFFETLGKDDELYVKSNLACLNMSRSLGDYQLKTNTKKGQSEQLISPEPEVHIFPRKLSHDEFLIMANSRVWDLVDADEMRDKLNGDSNSELNQITKEILTECYERGMNDKMKKDDMSVILIRLTDKPRSVIKKVAQDNTLAVKKSKEQVAIKCEEVNSWHSNLTSFMIKELEKRPATAKTSVLETIQPFLDCLEAKTYFNENQYPKAIALSESAIESQPKCAEFHSLKGKILYQMKKHSEAVESFNRAIALKSNDPELHISRGKALFSLTKYDDAIKSYNLAIQMNAKNHEYYSYKGNALFGLRQYQEAVKSYDLALKYDRNQADYHFMKGKLFDSLKKYTDAIDSYDKAIALRKQSEYYALKARAFFSLFKHVEAIQCLTSAIEIEPRASYFFKRGKIYQKLKQFAESDIDFFTALNMDRKSEQYKKYVDNIRKRTV